MKVLVTGGRAYPNAGLVWEVLDRLAAEHPEGITIVEGGATGADAHARSWAKDRDQVFLTYAVPPTAWQVLGRRAGPLRNQRMLDENPDIKLCIAFPGGTGTADMTARARGAGVEIREIRGQHG